MSRVDLARRRAAEYDAVAPDETPLHGDDTAANGASRMAKEPFPVERPDRSVQDPPEPSTATDAAVPPKRRPLIERINSDLSEKVVIDRDILPASREQYWRLAATLHHAQATDGLKVVIVSSAVVCEGKTLTAANLAMTLSESYRRKVLLIDGDLRRPSLHTVFNLAESSGLADGLTATDNRRLMVHRISARLALLPAGRPSSDPMAGLTSARMQRVLDESRENFDWVIVDSPPVALLPDAKLLASMVDGALLVVKAGATPYELVKRAITALGSDKVLGVVLNRAADVPQGYYAYGGGRYYGPPARRGSP